LLIDLAPSTLRGQVQIRFARFLRFLLKTVQHIAASSNFATYKTLNAPAVSRIRISRTPRPTVFMGIEYRAMLK
jgi:hypothetical protein